MHERVTVREAMDEVVWCLKGVLWHATAPLRRLPLCRLGWHEWCGCCSPHSCVRCDAIGPD